MTPEEIVGLETWEILKDIKEESLLPEENGSFFYDTTRTIIVAGGPNPTQERKWAVVRKLARDEKAIEIVKEIFPDWRADRNGFLLRILRPNFDEIYEKYRKACDPNAYLNDYQQRLIDRPDGDNLPQFSRVETPDDTEIDKWLADKDRWVLEKIWQVTFVLNSEWQLRDQNTFKIPIEKFVKDWVDNEGELEAILTNLHNRKIIEVSRKLGETPPTNDPNKPQGSICVTINDQPEIIRREDTQIKIFEKKFIYLHDILKRIVSTKKNKPVSTKKVLKKQIAEQALRPTNFTPRSTLPVKISAEEVIKNFSPQNYPFVLMVISGILSLTDFRSDGKIAYQLQSPHGQQLINERRLLDRLSQMGLLSHYGEDGLFGIVTLGNINVDVLREVESGLTIAEEQPAAKPVSVANDSSSGSELEEKSSEAEKIPEKTNRLFNKREMAKEVTRLVKICGLGKKEAELLKILSNFELKRTRELTTEIPTKDYKHVKGALAKKIKSEGWIIENKKGEGLNPDSFYILKRTTLTNN